MSDQGVIYKMPGPAEKRKMTGTAKCHVVEFSAVDSKYGPQIEFRWASEKPGSSFKTWLSIDRKGSIDQYMSVGVVEPVGMDGWRVVSLDRQPWVWVTLQDSKLKALTRYTPEQEPNL